VVVSCIGGKKWNIGKNYQPATSLWLTLSNNVLSGTPRHERDSNSEKNILILVEEKKII
jgi:hypothetical protein